MAWLTCPKGHNAGREYDGSHVAKCPVKGCGETLIDKWELDKQGREYLKARRAEVNNAIEKVRR
jgi:hypothetical protein